MEKFELRLMQASDAMGESVLAIHTPQNPAWQWSFRKRLIDDLSSRSIAVIFSPQGKRNVLSKNDDLALPQLCKLAPCYGWREEMRAALSCSSE